MSDKGDCRTAPATPVLLTTVVYSKLVKSTRFIHSFPNFFWMLKYCYKYFWNARSVQVDIPNFFGLLLEFDETLLDYFVVSVFWMFYEYLSNHKTFFFYINLWDCLYLGSKRLCKIQNNTKKIWFYWKQDQKVTTYRSIGNTLWIKTTYTSGNIKPT